MYLVIKGAVREALIERAQRVELRIVETSTPWPVKKLSLRPLEKRRMEREAKQDELVAVAR